MTRQEMQAQQARAELAMLRARYDGGVVTPAIFAMMKKLESEIAWAEHSQCRECSR